MDRLKTNIEVFSRALKTLEDITKEDFTIIVRDATIQRFEYTFEAFWKFVKTYLKVKEGIVCNSPKSCFRELFSVRFISEEETNILLLMTDKRNLASHTYIEKIAQDIYKEIIEKYYKLMKSIDNRLQDKQ